MSKNPSAKWDIGVLHGFRALMVLLVGNFHIWQQSWLYQAFRIGPLNLDVDFITRSSYSFVDGMILLSGFLLFLPYARSMVEDTPLPRASTFYLNRLARIVPSYMVSVLLLLVLVALPRLQYTFTPALWQDLWTHLTFTHTFFYGPYQNSQLNGVLWTVAIEMQMYLLFPLVGRCARRKPVPAMLVMAAIAWAYRAVVYYRVEDTGMLINQLPAFLDVYVIGMLGAVAYCRLRHLLGDPDGKQSWAVRLAGLLLFAAGLLLVGGVLRLQTNAGLQGLAELRLGQLRYRLPLTLSLMLCMLGAMFMPGALRWLFSNRLMRFLAAISYNFYIWHQVLAVQMKGWFPQTLHSDRMLQWGLTLLCFSVAILVSMAFTYGLEQPTAKGILKGAARLRQRLRKQEG